MSKNFASTGDMAEKKITFAEIGRDLYAFTAEGDPNSGIIIGDDGVIVIDAQATPAMAGQVIERVAKVTDKPIKYVVLSHYHAVRVLGASAYKAQEIIASDACRVDDRRARQGGLGFRVRPLPAPVPRRRIHSRADLADPHVPALHDALPRQAARRAAPYRPRPYGRRHRRLRARRQRGVLRRHRRIQVGLLLRRRAFHGLAGYAVAPRRRQGRCAGAGPRRRAGRHRYGRRGHRAHPRLPARHLRSGEARRGARRLAEGLLRRGHRRRCAPKYGSWPIFEHCQPFNIARAYDEAQGIDTPRIWTAERDRAMWEALQG